MYLNRFFTQMDLPRACVNCADTQQLPFDIRMAFQPIVDASRREVFAYEALVRGENGEGAAEVIARVTPELLYRFDQTCRVKAIATAAALGLNTRLSINFNPNAVYEPASCIRMTLAAATACGFDTAKLIFEMTESQRISDVDHMARIVRDYHARGFLTAIDDFGAGHAGLNLLAAFQPDVVKLDMALIRGVDHLPVSQAICAGVVGICRAVGCTVLAEGVETIEEYRCLRAMGIDLFQGYLIGRPTTEAIEPVSDEVWARLQ
jgi:EAL domain-containing protein (putative c-di-GMP-specific phosphodiesterase class I)